MREYPIYRLMDGDIVCQAKPCDRWSPVDKGTANEMLTTFDGLSAQSLLSLRVKRLKDYVSVFETAADSH